MSVSRSGVALGAAGIALMCAMDAVAKALGAELTTFQIVFVRYFGAALWLALWIWLSKSVWPQVKDMPRQALRAVLLVILKHHSSREHPAAMTLGQSLFAAVLSLPLALGNVQTLSIQTMGQVVLVGLLGAVGFLVLINGLKRIPVSAFAVVEYTGLVWAALFGLVFFGEVPGVQFWVGGALIVGACALTMGRSDEVAA